MSMNGVVKVVLVASATLGASALSGCLVLPSGEGTGTNDIVITDDACYERCEARNETCSSSLEVSCRDVCDLYDDMSCLDEVNAYDDCRDDEDDICGAPETCRPLFDEAMRCIEAYCDAHPEEENVFCF